MKFYAAFGLLLEDQVSEILHITGTMATMYIEEVRS